MHSTGSYIYTLLERVRAYLDDPDLDAKYTDDYILRHAIGPAQVDVLSRLWLNHGAQLVMIYDLTLDPDVTYYQLPPCIQQVKRFALINADNLPTFDAVPRSEYHRNGPGWALEGNPGSMALRVDVPPTGNLSAQLWYTSNGDVIPHYATNGSAATQISFTGASYDSTNGYLTKTGAFANYEFEDGDKVTLTAGTSTTLGDYLIASKVDSDSIALVTNPGASASNISGRLWSRWMTLSTSPTVGTLDYRENAYCGQTLRILPGGGIRTQEVQIDRHTFTPATTWKIRTRMPFDPGTTPSAITYEIAPPGSQSLYEAISVCTAMKLGAARKISESHHQRLVLQYRMALKTIGDNLTNANGRMPRHIDRDTVDNPLSYQVGWIPLR